VLVHIHNLYDNNLTIADHLQLEVVPRKGEILRLLGKNWVVLDVVHSIAVGSAGTHMQEIHIHAGEK